MCSPSSPISRCSPRRGSPAAGGAGRVVRSATSGSAPRARSRGRVGSGGPGRDAGRPPAPPGTATPSTSDGFHVVPSAIASRGFGRAAARRPARLRLPRRGTVRRSWLCHDGLTYGLAASYDLPAPGGSSGGAPSAGADAADGRAGTPPTRTVQGPALGAGRPARHRPSGPGRRGWRRDRDRRARLRARVVAALPRAPVGADPEGPRTATACRTATTPARTGPARRRTPAAPRPTPTATAC